jgi:hypothetical protein
MVEMDVGSSKYERTKENTKFLLKNLKERDHYGQLAQMRGYIKIYLREIGHRSAD